MLDEDGWVTTGDLGWRARTATCAWSAGPEMYIRGGYNVYPAEVEAVLGAHPAVAQVAVVGSPDPVLGEIGVAFVVRRPAPPDADRILADLRAAARRGWPTTRRPTGSSWSTASR